MTIGGCHWYLAGLPRGTVGNHLPVEGWEENAGERPIVGAFHQISRKHLDRYIEEIEWRFNNRNNPHMFRDTVKRILTTDPLRYRALVDKKAA